MCPRNNILMNYLALKQNIASCHHNSNLEKSISLCPYFNKSYLSLFLVE
jgi:hypothetical protein